MLYQNAISEQGKRDWADWFRAALHGKGNEKGKLWESEHAWIYVSGSQPAHSDPTWLVTSGERARPFQDLITLCKLLFLKTDKYQPTHSIAFPSRVQKDAHIAVVCKFSLVQKMWSVCLS